METGDTDTPRLGKFKKLQFTDVVGNFGKWQLIICLNLWWTIILNPMNNMIITFHAPNVDHYCSMPEDIKKYNVSSMDWISHGIPREDGGLHSKCTRYETWDIGEPNRSIVPCDQWDYDTQIYTNTIVNTFDLVCDRKWMISLLKSSFMWGYMVAGTFIGIGDSFGRRPVILTALSLFLVSSFLSAFSTSFVMLIVLRFLIACGITTSSTVSFVLQAEIVGAKERVYLSYFRASLWSVGMLILAAIAYFIRDWSWLQVTVTLPAALLIVGVWWFVPESPRYLLTHGHEAEASQLLKKASRLNAANIDNEKTVLQDLINGIEKDDKQESHASFFDLFRTPELRKRTLVLGCFWFVTILVYYGITYNTNHLHGDMYINFAISAAVEVPGLLVFLFISRYAGRRRSFVISMTLCGIMLISSYMVPEGHPWGTTAALMIAKAFMKGSLADTYIYTAEIYPTVLRNIGIGTCSAFSRFGGMLAPFAMGNLGDKITHLLFGVLSVCVGLSVILLPETNNMNILDTIKEARNFGRKQESSEV